MSRKPFNWSLLDRNSLYSMLYGLKSSIVDKRLPIKTIQALLKKHIKSQLPIKVKIAECKDHAPGCVYIGGTYYADNDARGNQQVEVIFSYRSKNSKLTISEHKWSRICLLFADTVLHEIIHMRQYRSRNFKEIPGYLSTAYYAKDRKEQEYYGHKDEMGAFSFNIACELYDKFGDDITSVKKYLDSNLAKKSTRLSWNKFLNAFDWNHNHTVVRSMKKKIIRNFPYAIIGKPFKTPNHLTY